ncbi:MAG: hypothetical protein ACD_63C00170G0002 [uncultured bacterium]|nr:MAG: hypothetical protein ACD_63C00170G0002 [uncultured bacterium]
MTRKIIDQIENQKNTFSAFLITLFVIILLRTFLWSFLIQDYTIPDYTTFFLLTPLFYFNTLISIMLITYLLTKTPIGKLANIMLYAWILILLPPLLDIFFTKNQVLPFLLFGPNDFFYKMGTYLIDMSGKGHTIGTNLQLILIIALFTIYVFLKTKSKIKAITGAIIIYIIIFLYTSIPSILGILVLGTSKPLSMIREADILNFLINTRESLLIFYKDPSVYVNIQASLFTIPVLVIQLLLLYLTFGNKKLASTIKSIRFTRFIPQLFVFFAGIMFSYNHLNNKDIFTFQFILSIIVGFLAVLFSWLYATHLNDVTDIKIDRLSNTDRPLPSRISSVKEFKILAFVFIILTLMCSLTLGYKMFVLFMIMICLPYIYSMPPFRLRRWPVTSNLLIAGQATIVFIAGYLLFNSNNSLINLPKNLIALIFVVIALISSVKDIKDFRGDGPNRVYTIPTIFGLRKGKIIIGILSFTAFILFPIFLKNADLLLVSAAFGIAELLIILDQKLREKWIFGMWFVYIFLVALIAF